MGAKDRTQEALKIKEIKSGSSQRRQTVKRDTASNKMDTHTPETVL